MHEEWGLSTTSPSGELLGILLQGDFLPSCLFLHSIIYLHGLVDIYFIPWIIMQVYSVA